MIKVLLERRTGRENVKRLLATIEDLRAASLRQPGYVTGETLVKGDDPVDVLVISTWISEAHYKAWTTLPERIELNDIISHLVDGETKVSIYKVPTEDD